MQNMFSFGAFQRYFQFVKKQLRGVVEPLESIATQEKGWLLVNQVLLFGWLKCGEKKGPHTAQKIGRPRK